MSELEDLRIELIAIRSHLQWLAVQHFRARADPIAAADARRAEVEDLGMQLIGRAKTDDAALTAVRLASELSGFAEEVLKDLQDG